MNRVCENDIELATVSDPSAGYLFCRGEPLPSRELGSRSQEPPVRLIVNEPMIVFVEQRTRGEEESLMSSQRAIQELIQVLSFYTGRVQSGARLEQARPRGHRRHHREVAKVSA